MAFRVGHSPNNGIGGERCRDRGSSDYYSGHGRTLSVKNKRRYALYSEKLQSLSGGGEEYVVHHHHHHHYYHHHHGSAELDREQGHDHQYFHDHNHDHEHDHDHDHDHGPGHLHKRVKDHHYHPPPTLMLRDPEPIISYDDYNRPPTLLPPPLAQPSSSSSATTPARAASTRPPSPQDMERTESGLSISSDTGDYINPADEDDEDLLSDDEAARQVCDHILLPGRHRRADTQSERILRSLVNPRHDYRLDDNALLSLFSAANELFFLKRLGSRVAWDWSHSSSEQYARHIVGTTALRRSATRRGYETLIVLSTPILKDTSYNRRLLISTFLHEMIHSYLFVTCGLKAKENGGHTPGFRKIASAIDDWVGKDYLHLRDMEADLERYRGQVNAASNDEHDTAGNSNSNNSNSGHPEQQRWAPSYPLEDESYRTRSPASHPNWQWAEREDFGAPRHTRTQAEEVPPPSHTGTYSPSIATYVPPSYHSYHPPPPQPPPPQQQQQPYGDEHYQRQPQPVHRYPPH